MKIAMVSEHANPLAVVGGVDAGGQNVHVAALAQALAKQGHEVVVHTRRDDPDIPDRVPLCDGVVVEHVPAGPMREIPKDDLLSYIPAFGHQLAQRWIADPPAVVHAHFWMSGLASLIGARDLDVPVVQTFHALGTVKRRHQGRADTSPPQRLRFEAAIARGVDAVIATCSDEVQELVRMGTPTQRIDVVPCGVDLELFTDSGPALPRTERRRLVTVGRLVERKGVQTVIQALPRIGGTELLIAGGGDFAHLDADPDVRRLRAEAERHGVADRVHFLGRVLREDMPALLRSADIVVTVPWYEPFGIVPLEAMACGKPVVGSAVGGLLDTVVPDVTGVLVPPRRPEVLVESVASLLGDPLRLQSMGLAAVDRARSRFGWQRIAEETLRTYDAVIEGRMGADSLVAVR
jgi:glycosyltransferase involved in cell wall biosynthesis